jgi:hypothetical protein
MCKAPNGNVTFEESNAEGRELAMGFPRGLTTPGSHSRTKASLRSVGGQAAELLRRQWT